MSERISFSDGGFAFLKGVFPSWVLDMMDARMRGVSVERALA